MLQGKGLLPQEGDLLVSTRDVTPYRRHAPLNPSAFHTADARRECLLDSGPLEGQTRKDKRRTGIDGHGKLPSRAGVKAGVVVRERINT